MPAVAGSIPLARERQLHVRPSGATRRIIGLAEAFATGYAPQGSTFQDLYVFAILIVFLLVRPQGILGKPEIKKV